MKYILLFFVLTTWRQIICSNGQARRKNQRGIRRVMSEQTAAWNAGNIEGFMRGYWNSPELKFVSGMNVTKGWQPTLERYKKKYDSRAKMGILTFSDWEITVCRKTRRRFWEVGRCKGKMINRAENSRSFFAI